MTLPADGEIGDREGALHGERSRRARVLVQDPDAGAASRSRRTTRATALIQVNDRAEKVLYYEGEPRVELKFLRRAVEDDKNLQVVSLDRTAENNYYRQSVSNPDELVGGFPKTREELFQYRAIILGSVEAASFSPEQLRMTRRLRQQARRRTADARRTPIVRRRRLGRHAGRRGAPGRDGRVELRTTSPSLQRASDARRRAYAGHPDRCDRRSVGRASGSTCRSCPR